MNKCPKYEIEIKQYKHDSTKKGSLKENAYSFILKATADALYDVYVK